MTNEEIIRAAWLSGVGGGTLTLSGVGTAQQSMARVTLQHGVTSPWVVTVAPVVPGERVAWSTPPVQLFITLANPGGAVEFITHVGALGGIVSLPPSASIIVNAAPGAGAVFASLGQVIKSQVSVAPGGPGHGCGMFASPIVNVAALGGSQSYVAPSFAVGYRLYSPQSDFTTARSVLQRTGGAATTIAVDSTTATTFYGNANGSGVSRESFLPLHPQTVSVLVFNGDAVAQDIGVEWLQRFGG